MVSFWFLFGTITIPLTLLLYLAPNVPVIALHSSAKFFFR